MSTFCQSIFRTFSSVFITLLQRPHAKSRIDGVGQSELTVNNKVNVENFKTLHCLTQHYRSDTVAVSRRRDENTVRNCRERNKKM